MKKILFVANIAHHFKGFHLPYFRWFQEQGWEVHTAAKGDMYLPHVDRMHDIDIRRSPFHFHNIRAYKQLREIIRQNRYDIIHCHTPMGGVLGRLAARGARKQGTKVIYTAHGFHFCKGAPLLNWVVYYPIERILSTLTDCLVTINDEDHRLSVKHGFRASHIAQVHGVGVDTEAFLPAAEEARQELRRLHGYGSGECLLFYAAEFNRNKNQQMLIRALAHGKKEMPDARLLLAGEGPLLGSCRELAIHLGVEERVDFLGYRTDIPSLLPMCDIAVSSSLREGLPVNIMEAMACGLPVVATGNRGHRELVESGETGWIVEPGDAAEMWQRISALARDTQLRLILGTAGRRRIESRYGKDKVLAEMASIYKRYMGVPAASGSVPIRVLHAVVNMNRGGAETLIMNLYRNMDRSRVQFDFLTCKPGVFDEEIRELGGNIHLIPYVTEVGHVKYTKALDAFFAAHPEYSIVHAHMDKMSGLVLRSARKAEVPVRIAHSHNTRSEGGIAARLYKGAVGTRIKPSVTHRLACSEMAAKWLYAKAADSAQIVQNGIECERFAFSPEIREQVREELQIRGNEFAVGHVGRFAHQKNHAFLIEAFARFVQDEPDAVLLLAGDGPLRSGIERKVGELNLSGKVKLLGVRGDVHRLLQAFDVFVFPSFHEGLPVTLIEAQGSGLPCLISDAVTREVDMGIGLVDYFPLADTTVCVEKMKQVAEKKASRQISTEAFSENGYDIKRTADRTKEFYLTVSG